MSEVEPVYTVTYLAVGAIMFGMTVYKVRAWANERIPSLLLMAWCTLAAGVGFISAAPGIYRWLGQISGVSNLGTLVVYNAITACYGLCLVLVRLWSSPAPTAAAETGRWPLSRSVRDGLRRVALPYGGTIVAMTILFLSENLAPEETPLTFDTTFAERPNILAFLLLYQTAFIWALGSMVYVCAHQVKVTRDPALRSSLRFLEIGCSLVMGYCVCKIIAIMAAAIGSNTLDPLSTFVGPGFASIGGTIMAAGWAYAAIRNRRQRRRDFHALEALWTRVTQADPGVILNSRPPRMLGDFHALRRVHEIRDGQLALRLWTSQSIVDVARRLADEQGLEEPDRDALIAAAALQSALHALQARQAPQQPCEELPGIDIPPHAERQHLVAVARYMGSPLVTQALVESRGR
ncbi:MAB_1171c family putative transporter [Streptomyces sparsogenes]|uniref:MAB_1171c family putative transporter n=1 Tax=Streptomyces sparsogenes TaxID=67365 RepID=UPI00385164C9